MSIILCLYAVYFGLNLDKHMLHFVVSLRLFQCSNVKKHGDEVSNERKWDYSKKHKILFKVISENVLNFHEMFWKNFKCISIIRKSIWDRKNTNEYIYTLKNLILLE